MKASESLPNYDSKSRETTNFIIKSIKTVCKDSPSRPAGSEAEEKAQQYVADTMKPFADSVETQEFKAKIGIEKSGKVLSVIYIIAIILACIIGVVCFLLPGRNLSKLFAIPIFFPVISFVIPTKKGICRNVIAIKKPSGEIQRRIVFMGGIDSPTERTLYRIGSVKLEKIVVVLVCVGIVLCSIANLLFIVQIINISPLFALAELIFIPAFIGFMRYYNTKQEVQGANGNLTGLFDSMAVIQYLSYNNLSLENTEVVAVSCGGTLGVGALSFLKKYEPVFNDADTLYVSVDTLQSDKCFAVSGSMADILKSAAENATVTVEDGKDKMHSSFEGAFIGKKVLSYAHLSGLDIESGIYATREDVPTALSPMAIEAGLKISLETAYLFDEKGLQ